MRKAGAEVQRLERLWRGGFGDAYSERNANAAAGRGPFWQAILERHPAERVLEVGCNVGPNLRWIREALPPAGLCGVDLNERALARVRRELPRVHAVRASARALPFSDARFDLVFTAGVLIHQAQEGLPAAMAEVVRCSRRYVLCIEYFAPETLEVPYRGESGALFKRDYGRLYQEAFPQLGLLERGTLGRAQGWDDVTYWMFERTRGRGAGR